MSKPRSNIPILFWEGSPPKRKTFEEIDKAKGAEKPPTKELNYENDPIIHYGTKYFGKRLSEIPDSYCIWVFENHDDNAKNIAIRRKGYRLVNEKINKAKKHIEFDPFDI
jgi:hypothetical protein